MGNSRVRRKTSACYNCGEKLSRTANFCPNCGQENHNKKVPVKVLIMDFAGDYLTVDSKLLRSLRKLIFHPGAMSEAYADGKRMTYIKPIRFYLFVSFLLFLILNLKDESSSVIHVSDETSGVTFSTSSDEINDEDSYNEYLQRLQDSLQSPDITEQERIEIEESIDRIRRISTDGSNFIWQLAPYAFFLMVPMLALIFFGMFFKRRKFYVEHLILSLHVHTFAFILLSLLELIAFASGPIPFVELGAIGILLVHTAFAMRRMYRAKWVAISLGLITTLALYLAAFGLLFGAIVYILLQFYA